MALQIHTAPADATGQVVLGRTLLDLVDGAVERYPNARALNSPDPDGGWTSTSNADLQGAVDELAAGLRAHGLSPGGRVAFFMHSDADFLRYDLATLLAGLVNAPLYTTFARESLVYVTAHAEATALVVSDPDMLAAFAEWAPDVPAVRLVVLASGQPVDVALPDGVRVVTTDTLRDAGRQALRRNPGLPAEMRAALAPSDLATLIYTSGTTGRPKGVMLSHENVSFNGCAAISAYPQLGHQDEHALTFLPMTHVYARAIVLTCLSLGHSLYFSSPDALAEHLASVRPTLFATVPRVLEKVYDKVALSVQSAPGLKKAIGTWALGLAARHDLARPPQGLGALAHALADRLVFSALRERTGLSRVKVVSVGAAALRADLANAFAAMGIPCYQGYGLTETSPVITAEVPGHRAAGSVGPPIAGVEVAVAPDGEILTRGPHVMQGYYRDPEATAEVLGPDGWFHTGDIGAFGADGLLRITDRKKALFKLSTGKYVVPQPVENALAESPLVDQAVVVGNGRKYAAALLFPNPDAVRAWARAQAPDADPSGEALYCHPAVLAEFERAAARANRGADPWCRVQRVRLVAEPMSLENGLLTPKLSVRRAAVSARHADEIEALYASRVSGSPHGVDAVP